MKNFILFYQRGLSIEKVKIFIETKIRFFFYNRYASISRRDIFSVIEADLEERGEIPLSTFSEFMIRFHLRRSQATQIPRAETADADQR